MASPATTHQGCSLSPTKDDLIKQAHAIAAHCGVSIGTRKIFTLVNRFKDRMPNASGEVFGLFFMNSVEVPVDRQRQALMHPEIAKLIPHPDPVGEIAVTNVLRERGF